MYVSVSTLAGLYLHGVALGQLLLLMEPQLVQLSPEKRKQTDEKKKEEDSEKRHLTLWRGLGTKRKKREIVETKTRT